MAFEATEDDHLLVWGYVRSMEKSLKLDNIPYELYDLIYEHKKIRDKWIRVAFNKRIKIDTTKRLITIKSSEKTIIYGSEVVTNGVFTWTVKIISAPAWKIASHPSADMSHDINGIPNCVDKYSPYIGIAFGNSLECPCIPYQLDANNKLYDANYVDGIKYKDKCKWREQGDIIRMKLDLTEGTLSFNVNGDDFGVAFWNLKVTGYRLAITLYEAKGTQLQLC